MILILDLLGVYLLCRVSSGRQRSWHLTSLCPSLSFHNFSQNLPSTYSYLVLLSLNLSWEYHIFKPSIPHECKLPLPDVIIKILSRAISSTTSTFLSCSVNDILRMFLSIHISVALNSILPQGGDIT